MIRSSRLLQYSTGAFIITSLITRTLATDDDHDHEHEHEHETTNNLTEAWIFGISSAVLISLLSLVSIIFLGKRGMSETTKTFFIGLAAGSMLATALLTLLPEATESDIEETLVGALLLGGIAAGMCIELITKYLHRAKEEEMEVEQDADLDVEDPSKDASVRRGPVIKNPSLAWNNIVGDAIHNFVDGVLIGIVYLTSTKSGILVSIAVIIHEFPQEIGDYFVLRHAGWSPKKALIMNLLSALTAVVGCVIGLLVGEASESTVVYFLPIAAGQFIYIALAHLMPDLLSAAWSRKVLVSAGSVLLGGGIIAALLLLPDDFSHSH